MRFSPLIALLLMAAPVGATPTLAPHGDFLWQGKADSFGGFSGLVIGAGGASALAITDRGYLYDITLTRDADTGLIRSVGVRSILQLLDNRKRPVEGFHANSEDLSMGHDGLLYVAFEGYTRISGFRLPDPTPHPTHRWNRFEPMWGNASFEALATLRDGRLMTVAEMPVAEVPVAEVAAGDPPHYRVFVQGKADWSEEATLPAPGGYAATGADLGPDGRLYLLERRQNWALRFQTRIRRFSVLPGKGGKPEFGAPETLLETQPGALDNMEGISLWSDPKANVTVISLISDDNFMPFQSTRIVEYTLQD